MQIQLTKKQAEYIRNAHHRWNFAIGAVRSGKSHLAIQYTIPQCLKERKGKSGINVILGATQGNIKRNVLEPMREIWGSSLVSELSSDNTATIFGEKVYCLGAETKKASNRLRGSEIKFCYCDEATDINEEAFDMLKSRLSLSYSVCHAAANPQYPTHFIKRFIDSAERGVDIYTQHYTIYDNPFLPKEYVRSLEAEYAGTVYEERYIKGNWVKAEGLVYPMYTECLGKYIPEKKTTGEDIPPDDMAVSIDYGTLNAFAALLWYKKNGVWYAVRGYYYSGHITGSLKTDDDYANDMDRFLGPEIEQRENLKRLTYREQPKLRLIIDPSAASFITLMKRRPWAKVLPADNDVQNGIRETATAMRKGLIKVDPDIKEWVQEADGYVWDNSDKDRVVKENDHYMDSTRYFVKTMNVTKPKSEYIPLYARKGGMINVY